MSRHPSAAAADAQTEVLVPSYTALVSIPQGTRLSDEHRAFYALTYRFPETISGTPVFARPEAGMVAARAISAGDPYVVGDFLP